MKGLKLLFAVQVILNIDLSRSNAFNTIQPVTEMKITVGTTIFTATLYDNPTAKAFKAMLPLTINMNELNGNEKFYYFQAVLPTNAEVGGKIQSGDLSLYGNNCLVLFYEGLNSTYRYTKIGRIDKISGLAKALGDGDVRVKFE